tara:strand:- start:610 stop:783 length:174 start_codon:yes stop_codon:yes gene_type:complete
MIYVLIMVGFLSNDSYYAQEIATYDFKPTCETAVKARTVLNPDFAFVCIEREIKDAN